MKIIIISTSTSTNTSTYAPTGAVQWPGAKKHEQQSLKNRTPSAAPGPFSETGFPRLCSLYLVICVFFCDFVYGKTNE